MNKQNTINRDYHDIPNLYIPIELLKLVLVVKTLNILKQIRIIVNDYNYYLDNSL